MGVFKSTGKALGELIGNFKKEDWWLRQGVSQITQILVLNPAGKKVYAYVKGHVFHGDVKVGEAFHCDDGHEYVKVNGNTYVYDSNSDSFVSANP